MAEIEKVDEGAIVDAAPWILKREDYQMLEKLGEGYSKIAFEASASSAINFFLMDFLWKVPMEKTINRGMFLQTVSSY